MAWPYDAVLRTYGADQQLLSADLNDWQDRIVDLHKERKISIVHAYPEVDGGGSPAWVFHMNAVAEWDCRYVESIYFPIHGQDGFRLVDVECKYFGGGALAPAIDLYQPVLNFDASTTAPARGAAIATQYATAQNGVWVTASMTPTAAPEIYSEDDLVVLEVVPGQTGDAVAGVRATFNPITPTP